MLPTPISGLGGLMCHRGEVPLHMPVDAPHSNFGVWPIYILEGLCAAGVRHHCTCQWMFATPILGLGGLMCHWGEVLLYMPVDALTPILGFGLSMKTNILYICVTSYICSIGSRPPSTAVQYDRGHKTVTAVVVGRVGPTALHHHRRHACWCSRSGSGLPLATLQYDRCHRV